jgi:hypothetical protein
MNESQLCKTIKAHIAKGDHAREKAEQHYISAGQHLKTLQGLHKDRGGTWAEWQILIKEKCGIGKSRASELMQIADGRKTVEGNRAETAERVSKHREISPLRNGETDENTEESAWKQRRDKKLLAENTINIFLLNCATSVQVCHYDGPLDAKVVTTCRETADTWAALRDQLEVRAKREKIKVDEDMPTDAEAEESEQAAILDVMCTYWGMISVARRQEFLDHVKREPVAAERVA